MTEDDQPASRALGATITTQPAGGNGHGTSATGGAPDEAHGIVFRSRSAGPRLAPGPRTDPHPKGKDPS
ncbi:hypothetical protein [Streptomyces sp. NRRL F-5727]|uniref:hypothetical protein n=1 Tax=Streptomyces sp. NRRL F-5727 TaxID=1463871 RepID=UPI0004CBF5AB|nr:hypothetical protein [Streptomyces sp. NRRL F-5727]